MVKREKDDKIFPCIKVGSMNIKVGNNKSKWKSYDETFCSVLFIKID